MNPAEFTKAFRKLANYLHSDFPRQVGKEGVDHFTESFQNEGFTDKVLTKWQDVKRRTEPNPIGKRSGKAKYTTADRTRKILTGPDDSGLGDSIRWEGDYNQISFQTDVKYAQAHNEGTENAGRGNTTKIPKRQFMGPSEVFSNQMRKKLDKKIKEIFKR